MDVAPKVIGFDTETNGLYDDVTQIWCIGYKESNAPNEIHVTRGNTEDLEEFDSATELYGHNIINYDLPVIKKLRGWEPSENTKITDTLVMSRLLDPDRPRPIGYAGKGGPHSVECWGYRLGRDKVLNEVWASFSPVILRRVESDVEITAGIYDSILEEMKGHDWSQAIEIEHKVAEIITRQEHNGFLFDKDLALQHLNTLDNLIQDVDSLLLSKAPYRVVIPYTTAIKDPFKINGDYRQTVEKWYPEYSDRKLVGGPFTRIEFVKPSLSSQQQIKEWLISIGWKPTEWNEKDGEQTSAKLTEDSFESLPDGIGEALKNRTMYSHRRNQIQGWVDSIRADGRISAGANPCGTPTGRMRHHTIVNVPSAKAFFGPECRELFIVPEGHLLVGHDAAGLELRILAHYMGDEIFIEAILSGRKEDGTDIHTLNQRAAGLKTRDDAKTFIYALIYGAGDEKLGSIVGGTAEDGAELRKSFLKSYPKLDRLIKEVKRASAKGWIKGLDGRKIWLRKDAFGKVKTNTALNALIQSAGAIAMKKSMIILDELVTSHNLDVKKVVDMHDEAQAEVLERDVEVYVELAKRSLIEAGNFFNLKCPLEAEVNVGKNWKETH